MKFYNAMKHCLSVVLFAFLFIFPLGAQEPELTPEQRERKLYEYIDKEVELCCPCSRRRSIDRRRRWSYGF